MEHHGNVSFHKWGIPKNGWVVMENLSINGCFRGTPISGNLHMGGIKRTIIRILYTHNGDIYIYVCIYHMVFIVLISWKNHYGPMVI